MLPVPPVGSSPLADLGLVLVMDLTSSEEVIAEAYQRNIPTASVVNGHSKLDHITYPVYAAEGHTGYQRFVLEWILKVVNIKEADANAAV